MPDSGAGHLAILPFSVAQFRNSVRRVQDRERLLACTFAKREEAKAFARIENACAIGQPASCRSRLCTSQCGEEVVSANLSHLLDLRAMQVAFYAQSDSLEIVRAKVGASLSGAWMNRQPFRYSGGMPAAHPGFVVRAQFVGATFNRAMFVVFHVSIVADYTAVVKYKTEAA